MKYHDGREIEVGDRVKLWKDRYGTVVCSLDSRKFSEEFPQAAWSYLKSGIIVQTDDGEVFHYRETDEDFELVRSRAAP